MSDKLKVVDAMTAATKVKDHPALLELMTDDIEYQWRIGVRPIRGKAIMAKFLRNMGDGFDQLSLTVAQWAENGDVLLIEGVEQLYDRARGVVIDNPFMQAIEFRDGKICRLRDYYDSAVMTPAEQPRQTAGA